MNARQRLVRKIANLLRIAERDHGPEADTARLMAKRLMLQHGIDVVLEAEPEPDRPAVDHRAIEVELRPIWWRSILMSDIAPLYGCGTSCTRGERDLWFLWLFGPPDRVQLCAVHYEYLVGKIREVESLCPQDPCELIPTETWREGVCCGALQSLVDRLKGAVVMKIDPVKMEVEHVYVHNPFALVPLRAPERVEISLAVGGPDIRPEQTFPTVELDPPQRALETGYRLAQPFSPRAPSVCFGGIESLELSQSTRRILRQARITRVYDLMRMRPRQLLKLRGIGRGRFREVLGALSEYGLQLRPDW